MRLPALLLTALLLWSAGCASPSDADAHGNDADPTDPAPGPAPTVEADKAPAAPVTMVCEVRRTQAGTGLGFGLYLDRALLDDPGCSLDALFGDLLKPTGSVLIEATWTPQATMTAAEAWIEAADCPSTPLEPCPLPRAATAASPLTLKIEGDDYSGHVEAGLAVQVAAQGAVVDQPFTVHLTVFEDPAVPAGFSALG